MRGEGGRARGVGGPVSLVSQREVERGRERAWLWSGVLDFQVAGSVVWLRRLSVPARSLGRAGAPSRPPAERAAIDKTAEVASQATGSGAHMHIRTRC